MLLFVAAHSEPVQTLLAVARVRKLAAKHSPTAIVFDAEVQLESHLYAEMVELPPPLVNDEMMSTSPSTW